MDFLDASNVAGQTLLRLASRGNAIIAELVRLSEHIPGIFKLDDKTVQKKYADIILDFNYVGRADSYENKIENNPDLLELDSEVKETYLELLKRFYLLFESIYKYITDFLRYIEEVESGNTMQSLEAVVMDETGKQLMAEVIYLYGVMLLLVDELIEGPVRERMLISYLRYMGQNELSLIDEVCKLMARTTRTPSNPRPQGYPEDLFARIKLPSSLLAMILGRLRSDDLYNQQAAYPLPEHRSFALALQAQLLYVLLYFTPHVLRDEFAVMREIVDKHFPDNWVITYYLGFTADLTLVWDNYKAAKQALAQTIQANNVTALKNKCWTRVPTLLTTLGNLLREGVLTEQFILENRSSLLATLRECNVTLRWLMLHSRSVNKKLREQVIQGGNGQQLLVLLMNTAQFEFILKREFQALIDAKQERWEDCKKESSSRVKELSDFFSGEKPLSNIKKSERFQKWFGDIANTIQSLDYNEVAVAGRKLQQLMSALEEVEQFEQIETNLQVKQFLAETRKYLQRMVRIGHMTEKVMGTFDIITDIAYAWELIDDYVASMQALIKRDPANVIKLRAIFVKLSSILMVPLVRINQANSPDLASVSQYYTEKLEAFVRRVLEVIPASMFDLLRVIIDLQINKLKELPTRVEKDKLKE
jgi:WASH complex subunit strumpellin